MIETLQSGRLNEAGLQIIKSFEGWSANPYVCPAGVITIGYGNTRGFDGKPITIESQPLTKEEGERLLLLYCRRFERAIEQLVSAELTDNMFAALVSFVYNVGSGAFQRSTMRMKLNRGDYTGAANEFPRWKRAGGRVLRGLVLRRSAERELFLIDGQGVTRER